MKIKTSESCWRIGGESTLPSPERVKNCSGWEVRLHSWETSCWETLSRWWKKIGRYLSSYESRYIEVAGLHIPISEIVRDEVVCPPCGELGMVSLRFTMVRRQPMSILAARESGWGRLVCKWVSFVYYECRWPWTRLRFGLDTLSSSGSFVKTLIPYSCCQGLNECAMTCIGSMQRILSISRNYKCARILRCCAIKSWHVNSIELNVTIR